MNRIDEMFSRVKKEKRPAYIVYITAGDPTLTISKELILSLARSGVDLIELGVPFSDPVADGPVIQNAFTRALQHGVSLEKTLACIQEIRASGCQIPLVLFTYLNPVICYGMARFVNMAAASGADGSLILDLPPEEASAYVTAMHKKNLHTIFLVAPTSTQARIKAAAACSSGFLYCISRTGVTGARSAINTSLSSFINSVRKETRLPLAVGFGIQSPEQFYTIGRYADAVVVGSAIVAQIEKNLHHPHLVKKVTNFAISLKG